jgi:hypothetical protein
MPAWKRDAAVRNGVWRCGRCATVGVLAAACAMSAPPAVAASAARFEVGAAIRSVDPNEPVSPAGITVGQTKGTTNVHDPLQTRAMYISNGRRATVFVATDAFGQFAAVTTGPDLGLQAIREAAAQRVSALGGVPLRAQDIVVSSSHSHATGSVQGYWGPPPAKYMALLRDRQIEVIVAAARAARPAQLEWGTADGAPLNALTVAQQNAYEGWIPDGQVSVLHAVDPSGATIATYATIPSHPVLLPGAAFTPQLLSADYPGAVRRRLDALLGGVSIVAPGSLGRQTTPWSPGGADLKLAERQLEWFATEATSIVLDGLRAARPLDDDRIVSSESMVTTPITNGFVLALTGAQHLGGDLLGTLTVGKLPYALDRADVPPWQAGVVLSAPMTAVRLGGLLFLSQPGEPFAEIRLMLRDLVRDADQVVAISQAQDALGYYYPSTTAPFVLAYPVNDHALFNVAPTFGNAILAEDVALSRSLGFSVLDVAAVPPPAGNAYERALSSAVQFLASPSTGVACGGSFAPEMQAVYSPILHQGHAVAGPRPAGSRIHWDFGDGGSADSGYLFKGARATYALPDGDPVVRHAFGAGRYTVTASALDEAGGRPRWAATVTVFPELRAAVSARRSGGDLRLSVRAAGGSGRIVRTRWTLPGRGWVEGRTAQVPLRGQTQIAAEVTDAAGAIATVRVLVRDGRVGELSRTCSAA